MAMKKHPDAAGFQNENFTAIPGKGYVDEALDHRMPYVIPCVWNPDTLEPELMIQPTIPESMKVELDTADLQMIMLRMYEMAELIRKEIQVMNLYLRELVGEKFTDADIEE